MESGMDSWICIKFQRIQNYVTLVNELELYVLKIMIVSTERKAIYFSFVKLE